MRCSQGSFAVRRVCWSPKGNQRLRELQLDNLSPQRLNKGATFGHDVKARYLTARFDQRVFRRRGHVGRADKGGPTKRVDLCMEIGDGMNLDAALDERDNFAWIHEPGSNCSQVKFGDQNVATP